MTSVDRNNRPASRYRLTHYIGKTKNESFFEQTGPMTEAILLGTVAIRNPDQKLEWDTKALSIKNNPAANKLIKRNYREGWEVDGFSA